jgi:hypothetical protein
LLGEGVNPLRMKPKPMSQNGMDRPCSRPELLRG